MATNWKSPITVDQYAESDAENIHVSWDANEFSNLRNLDGRSVKTVRDLLHVSRDPRHDIVEKTYFLRVSNFNFSSLPSTLSGIETRITANRYGRITDDTVQFCLNGLLIGDNQATLDLSPIKIYGSNESLWSTNLSMSDIQNSSFGVVVRFKSHPSWPHKCSALIDAIEIRVH
jgi:hypothetical protein